MTAFALTAAALSLLALLPLLRALLRRPATAAAAAAPDRATAWALAVALPLAAAALYAVTGTPAALAPPAPALAAPAAQAMTPERIQGMVARLAERMKAQPDDVQGWRMLARSYETLGRFDDAVAAYRQLQRLTPDDSAMLLDYAVTLAMVKGRTLSGEPAALIQRVLTLQPDNLQALALAGSEAYERKDYPAAVRHWQAVLAQVPPGTEMAQSVQASIEKARGRGGRALSPQFRLTNRADMGRISSIQ